MLISTEKKEVIKMFYQTTYIKNLFTGEPLTLEVEDRLVAQLEMKKELIRTGEGSPMLGTVQELTRNYEFAFLPSFEEVLKIFFQNGYTDELMAQILKDFGIPDDFAQKLIEDEEFVEKLMPWFEGITGDGERAARTLHIIYDLIKGYFSPAATPLTNIPQ